MMILQISHLQVANRLGYTPFLESLRTFLSLALWLSRRHHAGE